MRKKTITVKPYTNKANGQLNISLPKKNLPKILSCKKGKLKALKVEIKGWEWEDI